MFPSDVWLLLDNDQMSYSGAASWATTTDTSGRWLGNTSTYDGSPGGTLTVTFQGLSIAFTGNTPSSSNSNTTFLAGIDSSNPTNCSFPSAGTQFYTQWYQSPTLSDGIHQVNLSEITVDVDYALITAGESTPFGTGTTIVVDNANGEISYTGSGWEESDAEIVPGGGWMSGPPLGNSTHRTKTVGDSFEFRFAGNNIGVYGIFQWNATGSISVDFTVDSNLTTSSTFFTPSGMSISQNETPHYEFFFANVSSGTHTLNINVTQSVGNQTFVFDYLTYEPAFSSLASKPNFTSTGGGPTTTTSAVGTATASSSSATGGSKSVNAGAIAGGAVGGILGLAAILLALFFFIKHRQRESKIEEALVSPTPFGSPRFDKTQYQNGNPQPLGPTILTNPTSPSSTGDTSSISGPTTSPLSPPAGDFKSHSSPVTFSYSLASPSDGSGPTILRPLRLGETVSISNMGSSVDSSSPQGQGQGSDTGSGAGAGAVGAGTGTNTQVQIDELRRRIDDLARGSDAPPAYS